MFMSQGMYIRFPADVNAGRQAGDLSGIVGARTALVFVHIPRGTLEPEPENFLVIRIGSQFSFSER